MIISVTCTYCGHYTEKYIPKKSDLNDLHCIKCGDANSLKVKDLETSKTDYYAGSPPFPQSPKTKELLDWMLIGGID